MKKFLMAYSKQVYCIFGVLLTIAAMLGLVHTFNTTVAKASDLRKVEVKLDQYILSNQISQLQNRIWQIEDRYGKDVNRMPPEWRNEYRCLKRDLEDAKRKLKNLSK